jgi:hypothetical protein
MSNALGEGRLGRASDDSFIGIWDALSPCPAVLQNSKQVETGVVGARAGRRICLARAGEPPLKTGFGA